MCSQSEPLSRCSVENAKARRKVHTESVRDWKRKDVASSVSRFYSRNFVYLSSERLTDSLSPFLRQLIFQSYVYFYYASGQFNESTGVTRRCVSTDESFFFRTNDTAPYDNALSGLSRDLSLLVNRLRATALSLFMQSSVTLQLVCRVTRFLSACDKHAYFYIDTYRVETGKTLPRTNIRTRGSVS